MYTKASFLKSLKHEAKIIKHLAAQVPAGKLDFRPTAKQRSTSELLQYLAFSALASATYALTQKWDHYDAQAEAAKQVTPATMAKAMDKQIAAIAKLLTKVSDASLEKKTVKNWIGTKMTFGEGLIEMVLKQLVAYRMQLFIYLKASGAEQLGTSDCWMGVKAKAKAQTA